MRATNRMRFMPIILALILLIMMAVPMTTSVAYESPTLVNLGTASSFGILAGTTITNAGITSVSGTAGGNIGLHPGTAFDGQEGVTQSGTVHIADTVAQQAKTDLTAAYNDAALRASNETIIADLGGQTLPPGVYTSASSIGLTGTMILDGEGDPNAVFIFQAGSTLTTASNSEIVLINDAQPCNVFWQVGSSATLGTNSVFVGHIMASASITATTGVEVHGQLLAQSGAVTLDTNIIINDACLSPGSLIVTKDVQGPVNDMILPAFEVTVTGPYDYIDTQTIETGNFYAWEDLSSGTYTVSEGPLNEDWIVTGTGEYTVQLGAINEVTITNTYTPAVVEPSLGALTVTKVVSGDIGDMILPLFEITVTGPAGFSATRTFVHGESFTWENLVPGVYTVTESRTGLSSEWTVSGEGTVQVVADQTALTTVTNAYLAEVVEPSLGALTVTKVVSGDIGDMILPLFEMTVTGPAGFSATRTFVHGESFTWENLVPGVYTVTESRTGLSSEWTVSGEGTVQVVADQTALTTVTNAYLAEVVEPSLGALTVTKVVSGDIGDMILPLFEITVTGPAGFSATRTFVHGESFTWENLVPGVYTVTESRTGLSSEWTVSGEGTVQVVADQTALTTVNNAYLPETEPANGSDDEISSGSVDESSFGALTVAKVLGGDVGGMTLPLFGFTVTGPGGFLSTRTLVHGESFTWENLVPGVYTVTESRTGLGDEWTVSGEGTVQVTAGQTALTAITNTYISEDEISSGTVEGEFDISEDELVTADQTDSPVTANGDEETLVLGIAELPKTGGHDLLVIFSGLILFGMGLMLRPKK